jgi:tripartite ATP-independent transporter DctM subunit
MIVALTALVVLIALILVRIPIAFAMLGVGFGALVILRGPGAALNMVSYQIFDTATNYHFAVLPLFILMGVFVSRARLSDDLYDACNAWLGHFRGGLAMATIAACGGFAAISGSSAATAATMAKVAMPSMRRYGYDAPFAAGTVAAGGTLGILIPPSALMIIYGILTESDIGALFIAGFLPGVLTVIIYCIVVVVMVRLKPEYGPAGPRTEWRERLRASGRVWGVVVLFILVLGGIFIGAFTASEAGGIGAAGALAFAIGRRKLNPRQFFLSLIEAGYISAQIFGVVFGALVFNLFINLSGFPEALIRFIEGLNVAPLLVIFIILGIYILLGMVLDSFSLIFLTVPIFVPMVEALGYDLIWFGILMVIAVEIGLITPPIGMNVFILKAMLPDVSLFQIYRGIMPFFAGDIIRLLIVTLFPGFVLWLPKLML